jgi:hypothetical protein
MARQRMRGSWFGGFGSWIRKSRSNKYQRPTRRLAAEFLETRNVMSVAPLMISGPTLAEYLAEDHAMGPVAPAAVSIDEIDSLATAVSMNQLALLSQAEGEGDDGTGDDGTGDDGTGDDGTGDDGTGDDGTGDDGTGDDGTGDGGTGDGGTGDDDDGVEDEGDGTGGDGGGPSGNPTISDVQIQSTENSILVTGSISDNSNLADLTFTLDNGIGEIQLNEDGTFTINITDPNGYTTFTFTVTDPEGNTTTYTFTP